MTYALASQFNIYLLCFQQGEGSSRGLLRDCENVKTYGSFAALIRSVGHSVGGGGGVRGVPAWARPAHSALAPRPVAGSADPPLAGRARAGLARAVPRYVDM